MNQEELEQAIAELRRSDDELHQELAAQKELNQQQSEQIRKSLESRTAQADIAALCGIAFIAMLAIALLSFRVQGNAVAFTPLETFEKILGVPTVAAVATAIAAALLKKYLPEQAKT